MTDEHVEQSAFGVRGQQRTVIRHAQQIVLCGEHEIDADALSNRTEIHRVIDEFIEHLHDELRGTVKWTQLFRNGNLESMRRKSLRIRLADAANQVCEIEVGAFCNLNT